MTVRTHTDSSIVEYHEDGTWTETTTITHTPATRNQKIAAWTGLGLLAVAPVVPVLCLVAIERIEEKREARRAKKAAKLTTV